MPGKYIYNYTSADGVRYLGGIFRFRTEGGRVRALYNLVKDITRKDVVKKDISVILHSGEGHPLAHYAEANRNLHLLPGLENWEYPA